MYICIHTYIYYTGAEATKLFKNKKKKKQKRNRVIDASV